MRCFFQKFGMSMFPSVVGLVVGGVFQSKVGTHVDDFESCFEKFGDGLLAAAVRGGSENKVAVLLQFRYVYEEQILAGSVRGGLGER